MIDHLRAWREGDVGRATDIWHGGLAQLQEYVFSEMSRLHIRYKAAAWLRGFIDNPLMRPPMPRPRAEEVDELYRLLGALGVSVIERDVVDDVLASLQRPVAAIR